MTMSPPGKEGEEEVASRTYYQGRYGNRKSGSEDTQTGSASHESKYWGAWGPNQRDSYGYGSHDHGYKSDYDEAAYYPPPSQRFLEARSDICRAGVPGYKLALQDTSFALGLFVMGALATYLLYQQAANLGGRHIEDTFLDGLWSGLEEFEEKIDKIAEGQDSGDDNWISKIYNQFSFFNDVENSLTESDLDGIEPPILDETWGLGLRNSSTFKKVSANTTVEDPVKLEQEATRKKREVIDVKQDEDEIVDSEEKCRVDMWRCLSSVIEGGLHYIDNPEGLYGLAKKTMFKVAFHGGVSNVWSGLMTIPEARQIKKCMTGHQECVSYEVLRREAKETMDPADPSFTMYDKETNERLRGETEKKQKHKRERLIINPEFVESMDLGDGAEQFDVDYSTNQV